MANSDLRKNNSHWLPLNIWKLEAYVRLSPTYIVEVPHISIREAGRKINGLKSWLPSSISWRFLHRIIQNRNKQSISPRNIPTACNYIHKSKIYKHNVHRNFLFNSHTDRSYRATHTKLDIINLICLAFLIYFSVDLEHQ